MGERLASAARGSCDWGRYAARMRSARRISTVCATEGQCVACDDATDCPVRPCQTVVACLPGGSCDYDDQDRGTVCTIDQKSGVCCSGSCNLGAECCTDTECVGNQDGPVCLDGQCVACVTNSECADTPKRPVCDPSTNTCVACVANDDCIANPDGEVCNSPPTPACSVWRRPTVRDSTLRVRPSPAPAPTPARRTSVNDGGACRAEDQDGICCAGSCRTTPDAWLRGPMPRSPAARIPAAVAG